jgi:predicted alpha/beta-hydrolase family hydrolase
VNAGTRRYTSARVHRWVRIAFVTWAIVSTSWLANTMRTRGVADEILRTSSSVSVVDRHEALEFRPARTQRGSGLIFFCGSGVAAQAYAPMLRPIAEAGYPVFVIKLPYRFAPLEVHKEAAIARARTVMTTHRDVSRWVVAGHSLGGALAARMIRADPANIAAMVLIGTTHPKQDDLSAIRIPVTKLYASNDGVAPRDRVLATKALLPTHTRWIEIRGGNHSQFGHYGHQLFDGDATITRESQQAITRAALLDSLAGLPPSRAIRRSSHGVALPGT